MLLKDKKIVIFGLANKYSIAAGIAKSMHDQGATLAFAYQNERLLKNLKLYFLAFTVVKIYKKNSDEI